MLLSHYFRLEGGSANHALQRTAQRVTVAADSGLAIFTPSHLFPASMAAFSAPPSLTLGSFGMHTGDSRSAEIKNT